MAPLSAKNFIDIKYMRNIMLNDVVQFRIMELENAKIPIWVDEATPAQREGYLAKEEKVDPLVTVARQSPVKNSVKKSGEKSSEKSEQGNTDWVKSEEEVKVRVSRNKTKNFLEHIFFRENFKKIKFFVKSDFLVFATWTP